MWGNRGERRDECLRKSGLKSSFALLRDTRHRASVGAEARGRRETGDVDSCCALAGMRWRSEEELRRREPLDDLHDSATERTVPERARGEGSRGGRACWWLIGWLEKAETKWKQFRAPPVCEETEVANAHEAARQEMKQEATQELIDRQSHDPLAIVLSGISPSESNAAVSEGKQSVVGDGDAMGVGAEIAQHVFWAAEGRLGVDDPILAEQ